MINNQLWLIYALIFGAVLLGVRALYWFLFRSRAENKIINRRLMLNNGMKDAAQVLDVLRQERGFGAIRGSRTAMAR
jgi:tight adherence protein B